MMASQDLTPQFVKSRTNLVGYCSAFQSQMHLLLGVHSVGFVSGLVCLAFPRQFNNTVLLLKLSACSGGSVPFVFAV